MTSGLSREMIALRVARELRDGMYVNLGFGLPTLICQFIPDDIEVCLHSENGIFGYGGVETDQDRWDIDLVNASGEPIYMNPGGCFTDLATSFGAVRGGCIDVAVLGAFQVSERGDLANWQRADSPVGNIGGAMELAVGAKQLVVAMDHTTKRGEPKVLRSCTYPMTASGVVDVIITDLAYISVTPDGLVLRETAPGVSVDEIRTRTDAPLAVSDELREMEF